MVNGIQSVQNGYDLNYSDILSLNSNAASSTDEETNIFETAYGSTNSEDVDANVDALYAQLFEAEADDGVILDVWNDIKEFTNLGTSVEKCDETIQKYQNGEITFEEAQAEIENFDSKQESSLNLFSNIAVGIAAIAAGAATGGAGAAAVIAGAAAGAVTKAGFKAADRATNEVEGDTLDAKQIAQDALSGAVTGGIAVATAGTGATTYTNGGVVACAAKSAATGVKTGAISGASNYVIDCTFDEDKDFDIEEFVETTATSAVVGGAVGVIMGGTNGVLRSNNILTADDTNVAANAVSSASYKITNDRVRAIAA